jgi:Zn finger protein HypA/HybF involved in hydrogenase expression
MHELSLVEQLLDECRARAQGRTVEAVSARCSSAIDPVLLSEGFALLAGQLAAPGPGGDSGLSKARLELETVPAHFQCGCGFTGELAPDHLAGHIGICPACGHVSEVHTGVELVALHFAAIEAPGPT